MALFSDKVAKLLGRTIQLIQGTVFWYQNKSKIYGCIVLDVQPDGYYLISISEACDGIPNAVGDILENKNYTVAWFSEIDLLPGRQIHIIGVVDISGDFNCRAGYFRSAEKLVITNCGQRDTWKHLFRTYCTSNCKMHNILTPFDLKKMRKTD